MKIHYVDLYRQYLQHQQEIDQAINTVIATGDFIGGLNNPWVKNFEQQFAEYLGSKYCIACANGTDALEICLKAMGIGDGDEVIVPALTWISTAEAVSNSGATPIFADIDPHSYTIIPATVQQKVTSRTKAIIPVHLYGMPAAMAELQAIAEKHALLILEDCAQAHGAQYHGKTVGTFGRMSTFSFYPGKNLGAYGDAGCMVTDDEKLAMTAAMLAQHGQTNKKFQHLIPGRNSRLDGIQAAILTVKLKYLAEWTKKRQNIAERYLTLLADTPLTLPALFADCEAVWHIFAVLTPQRDKLRAYLEQHGIPTGVQYPIPLPLLEAYAEFGGKAADYPHAVRVAREVLTLPIFPELTDEEMVYIVTTIKSAIREFHL